MPKHRGTPLHLETAAADARFSTTAWNADGIATLEAAGNDVRSTLEAGLRATLALVIGSDRTRPVEDRAVPIQGEGEGIADLFANLAEDLIDQIDYLGPGIHDVVIDGILRREGGGYVAWGYATEAGASARRVSLPMFHDEPSVEATADGLVIRATFRRSA